MDDIKVIEDYELFELAARLNRQEKTKEHNKTITNNKRMGRVIEDNGGYRIEPMVLYTDIFHLGEGIIQKEGEPSGGYKANPIGYYKNNKDKKGHFRIFFDDTFNETLKELQAADFSIMNGLTYFGRRNVQDRASKMFAMIFDIDGVTPITLSNFFSGAGVGAYPVPNYIVLSGHGLHFYYLFDEPIPLFPYTKIQLKTLKYALIDRLWNQYTSKDKKPQHQGINQSFRPAGSNSKIKGIITQTYKVNPVKFKITDFNFYVSADAAIDTKQIYRETTMSFAEAEKKYPAWADWVKRGKTANGKKYWTVKRDLYDWWKRQIPVGAAYKHRYFCILALVIYAIKCNIPKEEALKDADNLRGFLNSLNPKEPFTSVDIMSAFECFDYRYKTFPRKDIEKLTAIPIKINKRNGRPRAQHVQIMNAIRNVIYHDGAWRNKKGSKKKVAPEGYITVADVCEKLNGLLSKSTINRLINQGIIPATGGKCKTKYISLEWAREKFGFAEKK